MVEKSIKSGKKAFNRLPNEEFEALFMALDRDNEVEFRLLFTPLAQKNMISILRAKNVGFGDDFIFKKRKELNYIKSMHMGKECALITDGRFSGGTSGLSIGHISPEAASGGNIGKIKDGDIIVIDIPSRSINVKLSDAELEARPQQPLKRNRQVSKALRAYAQSVSSADKGGVRIIEN